MRTSFVLSTTIIAFLAACGDGTGLTTTPATNDESDDDDADEDEDSNEVSNPDPSDVDPTTSGTTADVGTSTSVTTTEVGTTEPTTTTDPTTGATTTTGGDEVMCNGAKDCEGGWCWFDYVDGPPTEDDFVCHAVCVDAMGGGNAEEAWCYDDDSCCDLDNVCNEMGYCVPAPVEDTDTDTDSSTTGDTGTGDTGTGDTTDTGDTDTGGVLPVLAISDLAVTANCQPMVPADPVKAAWTLDADNSGGDVELSAVLTKATLTYTPGNMEFVQEIKATPTMIGPVEAMMMKSTPMMKTMAVNNLPMDCDRCGDTVVLDVTFDVDGEDVVVSAEAVMECVF